MTNPLTSKLFSRLWHGADYNYEQWLHEPNVLAEDFRLMKLAGCTAMSVGIFSWAMLEPEDGRYEFGWLDRCMDSLAEFGIQAILATPSAAHPAWLSRKYPEVLRTNRNGQREPHRHRQNFCRTAPAFRRKTLEINTRLAERYRDHPALLLWHVSNEYGSDPCYCSTCLADFRRWLKARYGDLDALNQAWWTTFWSHRYTDWEEIEPVDPSNNGLQLDWQRYNSDQVLDFYLHEIEPLRRLTPDTPITTNFMRPDVGLDYWKFADYVDVACWDSYPEWHVHDDVRTAALVAFYHDLNRSYKSGQPFYLIESSPSQTNWQALSRLKRPGLLQTASAQALAHGAIGVNYFQWRQSLGGEEKFHGAVVAHRHADDGRVFTEVCGVGEMLAAMPELSPARLPARVGLIYDFENEWVLNHAYLPRRATGEYQEVVNRHYFQLWNLGLAVDLLGAQRPLTGYDLVIAPMLHMMSAETARRLADFVAGGGTLVTTYLTGWVGESDLVHRGAYPEPFGELIGNSMSEFDTFGETQGVDVAWTAGNALKLAGGGRAGRYAELLEPDTAETLAVYMGEFYAGRAAVTLNRYGKGRAIHIGAYLEDDFLDRLYGRLAEEMGLAPESPAAAPPGISLRIRSSVDNDFLFVMNFMDEPADVRLTESGWQELIGSEIVSGQPLPAYHVNVLSRPRAG